MYIHLILYLADIQMQPDHRIIKNVSKRDKSKKEYKTKKITLYI